nr:PAS domain-containing protein [Acuticoccus mangrovi]
MRGGGFSELHDLANAFNRLVEREHTAKAQLVASQQDLADRARLLAESQRIAHICSWQRDLRTQEVKWTEEAREILGIDTTYVDGEGTVFIDLVHPDDRAAFMAAREASYCGDGPTAIKHRIIRPDGELRFCVTRSVAKVEENGRAVVMAGTLQDVTDQEIAERADAEQRRILEMAGRIARFGGWTVDVGTWRVTWSREMCALHGLPEGATPTLQQVLAFIVAEDREKMTRAMMACINQGTPYDEECRVENAQGNVLWVRTVGEAVRDENGNIVKLAGALQDLTTQKNVEEMLRHTQRLEAVGKLTGGVAHDFNNMLTVIIGAAQIMVDRVSNDPMLSKLADMTLTAANRGAKLTSRLLAVAQRQTLAPKPTDLVGLLLGMENLLRRAIGEDIELEINSPANLSRAMIDPNELENAILNLCINARDAMPDGGVLRIDVEECWLGESMTRKNGSVLPGTYVMVSISDTGHGMDQATVSRCFEPFFTTKEEGRGSGLGLSMVFGFVKQSNGHIELDSEVGVGTTIKLYLPVVTGDVELEEEPEDLGTAESGNEFVLVVEDDDLVAASLESKLERLNYRVEVARNGPEAMRILRQHPDIDLLLTDIVMPGGMNGRRLAKEAGQLRPGLSVVLMSGYSDQLTATEGAEGPKILLRKPFTREQLAAALRRALETADTV